MSVHEGMFGGPSVEINCLLPFGAKNDVTVEVRLGNWDNNGQDVRLEIVPPIHLERPFLTTKEVTGYAAQLHLSAEVLAQMPSLNLRQ